MHTVSTYPMRDEDANLNLINTLRDRYQCNVGYSGHEVDLAISYTNSEIRYPIERHITLDRAMYGSDQAIDQYEPSSVGWWCAQNSERYG